MTRTELANELMSGCPDESYSDHEAVSDAIKNGDSWNEIEKMDELNTWPETYNWLKTKMSNL